MIIEAEDDLEVVGEATTVATSMPFRSFGPMSYSWTSECPGSTG